MHQSNWEYLGKRTHTTNADRPENAYGGGGGGGTKPTKWQTLYVFISW